MKEGNIALQLNLWKKSFFLKTPLFFCWNSKFEFLSFTFFECKTLKMWWLETWGHEILILWSFRCIICKMIFNLCLNPLQDVKLNQTVNYTKKTTQSENEAFSWYLLRLRGYIAKHWKFLIPFIIFRVHGHNNHDSPFFYWIVYYVLNTMFSYMVN